LEEKVLAAYAPLNIPGLHWAIVAETGIEEVFVPRSQGAKSDFLTTFAHQRGYLDILLLTSEGTVFHSVRKGPDQGKNVFSEDLSKTHLAPLVARVLETGRMAHSDFALYPPAGNVPVAFFAHPVLGENGVDLVVVLCQEAAPLTALMQKRTGLGETGETILVGPDLRMRSDSFQDKSGAHSLAASLTGTVAQNGADIPAVRAALDGRSGIMEAEAYLGRDNIVAYSPIRVSEDLTYALVALETRKETLDEASLLRKVTFVSGLGTALVVILIVPFLAGSLSGPVRKLTQVAQRVAAGDLEVRAEVKSRDETSILADSFNTMITSLKVLVDDLNQKAKVENRMRRRLEVTVRAYGSFVEKVGQGDLTHELLITEDGDQLAALGGNLNRMAESLRELTREMGQAVSSIHQTSSGILASTTQQAATASEQSAAVAETTSTVEEVRQTAQQTAERTRQVSVMVQESTDEANRGMTSVHQAEAGMAAIRDQVENISRTILDLSEKTQKIGEIISTVNDIADQSNLLALNAAIEAARAGEAGRGFAVVAEEVRSLAEQSRGATAQVREILGEIRKSADSAVMVTEEGTRRAETGVELSRITGQAIANIAERITKAALATQQIAVSTNQQLVGMDQITAAMESINQTTQEAEDGTRTVEAEALSLNALAGQLQELVKRYKLSRNE
ncbi:MAG: HAMP domain-containing protein, partial [Proteobacteria bacterium]|nr:HAMP domain-containing protein [Pseudomonadota bacterium]